MNPEPRGPARARKPPLPHPTGHAQDPPPGRPGPWTTRHRPDTMDHRVETRAQRIRDHLNDRMTAAENLSPMNAAYTVGSHCPRTANHLHGPVRGTNRGSFGQPGEAG